MDYATIVIERYRSPDGQPTCCEDHPAGKICRFLGTRNFGTRDVCMLGQDRDLVHRTLAFTRPGPWCEVWAKTPKIRPPQSAG